LVDIYEGDYNLVTDIPQLAGVEQLPPNWHFIGPIFAHLAGEVPPELLRLSHDRPIIYCAMGSSANRDILKTVVESFGGAPYTVIAPIKAHIADGHIAVPDNVLVYDWLPAPAVNPLADLAVIHGGQGTVQTACAAGTPFVGIGLQPEQESNIDAIVRQGSAIRIRKRRLSRHSLLAAIEQLLRDPSARQRAKEIQQISQDWNGTQNAAEFLSRTFS
jgi:UDP:flavonoid glycosyltransferase YjiC (YdhE family)